MSSRVCSSFSRPASGNRDHLALVLPEPLRHLFAQAERSHIGPDFLDIGQAFALGSLFASFSPAQGRLPVSKPDRILFLVVDDHLIGPLVFFFISWHVRNSFLHHNQWTRRGLLQRPSVLPASPENGVVDS